MSKPDGGPAFPVVKVSFSAEDNTIKSNETNGMTLRDYLAAAAMQGMIARGMDFWRGAEFPPSPVPQYAYLMADAMLEERAK